MQVVLACLEFVDEQLDRFDGDLPHRVPRLGPVSHEPDAEPGCGPYGIREPPFPRRAAVGYSCPAPEPHRRRYWAASFALRRRPRADQGDRQDASAVAARDADKVRVWLSRR